MRAGSAFLLFFFAGEKNKTKEQKGRARIAFVATKNNEAV